VTVRLPILSAAVAAATLSACAQSVERIPVTQAGLVPMAGFNGMAPGPINPPDPLAAKAPGKARPSIPGERDSALLHDFGLKGISWQLAQSLIPRDASQVMSQYVVQEGQPPELRPRDIYTKRGLEDLSFRDHPGLHVGNFRNLNAEEGYAMFGEDERLKSIRDFKDTARAIDIGGDAAEANGILKATDSAFLRDEYNPMPMSITADGPQPRSGNLLTNIEQLRLTWLEEHF
jgi:hypothetical protein